MTVNDEHVAVSASMHYDACMKFRVLEEEVWTKYSDFFHLGLFFPPYHERCVFFLVACPTKVCFEFQQTWSQVGANLELSWRVAKLRTGVNKLERKTTSYNPKAL